MINLMSAFFLYRIRVSKGGFKFFDWQLAQSRVCFVPLYENKKSLGMPGLDFLGVT